MVWSRWHIWSWYGKELRPLWSNGLSNCAIFKWTRWKFFPHHHFSARVSDSPGNIWGSHSGQTARHIVILRTFSSWNRPFWLRIEGQWVSGRSIERDGVWGLITVSTLGSTESPKGQKRGGRSGQTTHRIMNLMAFPSRNISFWPRIECPCASR